ncbi:MmgE/PrpD family protein [Euzebya tangerina]|uniref:MmgE/PrpD family protein n=1 Tax=Euzebya tangerina TaxID=591198 RepID=UPI0013C320B1|nr:MmgE/PrpD family protein [Euzebya tangerina]
MTLAADLAEWAENATIPDHVEDVVARHLADALTCAWAGRGTPVVQSALAAVAGDAGPCRLPGLGVSLAAPSAALVLGTAIHALDFDDTHAAGLVHASAPTVAAGLAVGQVQGSRPVEILAAIAVGMEIICRLGTAVRHGFHARGFHATSVCGTPAAAAVAARLSGADKQGIAAAMTLATSMSSGLLEFLADGSSTKQVHPGWAAHAGVMAARLAGQGIAGPAAALEGTNGLFATFTGTAVPPEAVTDALDERWEATRITIKPYPACQLVHAALDAAVEIGPQVDEHGLADITSITVDLPRAAADVVAEPDATKRRPRTPYEAKFSLVWSLAAMLHDGAVTATTFAAGRLADPALLALVDRTDVRLVESDGPAAAAPGRVAITWVDGHTAEGRVAHSSGGPDDPDLDQVVQRKMVAALGSERATALATAVDGLRRSGSPAALEVMLAALEDTTPPQLTGSTT